MVVSGWVLVETDFLFGLSKRDRLHSAVMKVLELHRKGRVRIRVSSAAPLEAALVLLSRGFDPSVVTRALRLMEEMLDEYRVSGYEPLTLAVVRDAVRLRSVHGQLTLFDALHMALSSQAEMPLLTADKTVRRVMEREGLPALDYGDLGAGREGM